MGTTDTTTPAANAGTVLIGDVTVNRIGLGTNRLTDTDAGHALLHKAFELGVNFIDTAHVYADGQSEVTIGNTLSPFAAGLVVATKGGVGGSGPNGPSPMGRPDQLRANLEESLHRLKADHIDLYQLHRVDPDVPFAETIGALKQFRDEGLIRHVGLSEVDVAQLEAASAIVPIVSVQNEYNVSVRKHEALVNYCEQHNVTFIPWFPLGGLYGDSPQAVQDKLAPIADKYGVTTYQLAIAWLLKRSPIMLPIPGTLSVAHLESNVAAGAIELNDDDYAVLL